MKLNSLYTDRLSESIKTNRMMTVLGAITRLFYRFVFVSKVY